MSPQFTRPIAKTFTVLKAMLVANPVFIILEYIINYIYIPMMV